jgi:hypothetical protein
LLLLLLFLRLRWTLVFRLWLRLRSCWRRDAFTLCLLRLLNATRLTLLVTSTSTSLLLLLLLDRRLRLLNRSLFTTLITHLELLSLRMIGRVVYAHLLRHGRRARDYRRVVELLRDPWRDVDLPATPR